MREHVKQRPKNKSRPSLLTTIMKQVKLSDMASFLENSSKCSDISLNEDDQNIVHKHVFLNIYLRLPTSHSCHSK